METSSSSVPSTHHDDNEWFADDVNDSFADDDNEWFADDNNDCLADDDTEWFADDVNDCLADDDTELFPDDVNDCLADDDTELFPDDVAELFRDDVNDCLADDDAELFPDDVAELFPDDVNDCLADDDAELFPGDVAELFPDDVNDCLADDDAELFPGDVAELFPDDVNDCLADEDTELFPDDVAELFPDDVNDCLADDDDDTEWFADDVNHSFADDDNGWFADDYHDSFADAFNFSVHVADPEDLSSNSQTYYCGICMEPKPVEEMFSNQNCSNHSFCNDCVGSYLATKIQENVSNVKCPDPKCSTVLEPHNCRSIIPKDVFERWEHIVCENMVLGSHKCYCPFKDCSAMLVNEEEEAVTVSECPHCNRLFCAVCKVAWHSGVDCSEFQRLEKGESGREDLMAMELAKNKGWKRCPSCNFYVEKTEGCSHISCRCGYQFCYACGKSWSEIHVC